MCGVTNSHFWQSATVNLLQVIIHLGRQPIPGHRVQEMINAHPQTPTMPEEEHRQNKGQRSSDEDKRNERYVWVHARHRGYRNDKCRNEQLTNDQIKSPRTGKVPFLALISKATNRALFIHLEPAAEQLPLTTNGAPQ